MARTEADLTTFTLASDYNPAHYKNWTEQELAALGDCKATAEVIKARLESHGLKVIEMYVIEHTDTDETKTHYHILIKFEEKQGATLEKIAEYIGVPPEIIEKLRPGRYSYSNMLAYLIHFKDIDKITYPPQNVVTLAGPDYMNHFNKYEKMWERGREDKARKGGKTLNRRFREAIKKLESGELSCEELAGIPEYRQLFLTENYQRKLEAAEKRVTALAKLDQKRLHNKLQNKEISKEEAETREEYKLAFKYRSRYII